MIIHSIQNERWYFCWYEVLERLMMRYRSAICMVCLFDCQIKVMSDMHYSLSNYWPLDCLLNTLLRLISKKIAKLHMSGTFFEGNTPVMEFDLWLEINQEENNSFLILRVAIRMGCQLIGSRWCHICPCIGSALVQVMAWHLFGASWLF